MKVTIVLAVLVSSALSSDQLFEDQEEPINEYALVKFGALCSGNPTNRRRGCDRKWGCGYYNAPRGRGLHKGLDIVCRDGATVYAPFDLKLTAKSIPYYPPKPHQTFINDGVKVSGRGLCVQLFYLKPFKYRGTVKKGQPIGRLLPMQKAYPGITSHVHVQLCDRSDPTRFF